MDGEVKVYGVPKYGNRPDEYEDAYAFSVEGKRFALADGATESSFADVWARALTEGFMNGSPNGENLKEWLTPLQRGWHARVPWERLPWFAEEKARMGAFATLVGLELGVEGVRKAEPAGRITTVNDEVPWWRRWLPRWMGGGKKRVEERKVGQGVQVCRSEDPLEGGIPWRAMAVGDSCLYQVRGDQLIRSFPLEHSEAFGSRPVLISSNSASNHRLEGRVTWTQGWCVEGDLFLMASDALAHWFLKEWEEGRRPWRDLVELDSKESFASWVAKMRESRKLKNDDTTLLVFRCEGRLFQKARVGEGVR